MTDQIDEHQQAQLTPDAQLVLLTLSIKAQTVDQLTVGFLAPMATEIIMEDNDMGESRKKLMQLHVDDAKRRARNALAELKKYNYVGSNDEKTDV